MDINNTCTNPKNMKIKNKKVYGSIQTEKYNDRSMNRESDKSNHLWSFLSPNINKDNPSLCFNKT